MSLYYYFRLALLRLQIRFDFLIASVKEKAIDLDDKIEISNIHDLMIKKQQITIGIPKKLYESTNSDYKKLLILKRVMQANGLSVDNSFGISIQIENMKEALNLDTSNPVTASDVQTQSSNKAGTPPVAQEQTRAASAELKKPEL